MNKRSREGEFDGSGSCITNVANCLMLLSHGGGFESATAKPSGRVFECKTCRRQFPSFQALGGHRASHKRPRLTPGGEIIIHHLDGQQQVKAAAKTHECSICGLEFALGQALGGHMRRHRAAGAAASTRGEEGGPPDLSLSTSGAGAGAGGVPVAVLKRSKSSRRVMCLDLNLTPLENGLDFSLEKLVSPAIHCFV